MAVVDISFREEFHQAILDGCKRCTARTKVHGLPGDEFEVAGRWFVIMAVARIPLGWVAERFFREEGCSSPAEFKQIWEELHPRKGYRPDWVVCHHWWRPKEASDD